MSELREAAQAVLNDYDGDGSIEDTEQAIDRLRAALAQPEIAQPVAWQRRYISPEGPSGWQDCQPEDVEYYRRRSTCEVRPLYAHPPRDEWRLASEPPEDGTPVIIWFASGGFTKAIALRGKWITAGGRERKEEEVTHWRDVQPPTEGAK